jgi:hypothetical protein
MKCVACTQQGRKCSQEETKEPQGCLIINGGTQLLQQDCQHNEDNPNFYEENTNKLMEKSKQVQSIFLHRRITSSSLVMPLLGTTKPPWHHTIDSVLKMHCLPYGILAGRKKGRYSSIKFEGELETTGNQQQQRAP